MSIKLASDAARTDGLGVKIWDYRFRDASDLTVFERPDSYISDRYYRFMLRLTRGMEHVGTNFAATKSKAAQLARFIQNDVENIESDEPYMLITRATHERGIRQTLALAELARRGLWLSPEQKQIAGISELPK